jgi:hypothetical protein
VIVWLPTVNVDVVKVALPPESVPAPMLTPPSRNVTVPVGVPEPGDAALTVAVNVTVWPNVEGFSDEVTVVELESLFTVWVMAADVLELKLVSPA